MVTSNFEKVLHFFIFACTFLQTSNARQTSEYTRNEASLQSSYFFYQQSEYPRDCLEVHDQCSSSNSSGVYFIKPEGYPEPFEVYCDNTDDSAGWTVIERRRIGGSVNFNRSWVDFKDGFGFLSHEFWIGNERLSFLTNQRNYQLWFTITLTNGSTATAAYNNFRIGDEFSNYKLLSVSLDPEMTDPPFWPPCPNNMVNGVCSCGQKTCQEPTVCEDTCNAGEVLGCICPEGFYMKGDYCVPKNECACFDPESQIVVPEGETYINADCTRTSVCSNGQLTVNERACGPHAVCEVRDDVRKCYCDEGYRRDGEQCVLEIMRDCMDVYNRTSTLSGVYNITPNNWPLSPFRVYCDMTDGGGWTVFQRREDGSVDFYLEWDSYKYGFGEVDHEHWLGNEQLYYLTNQRKYELRIDMVNRDGDPYYAKFDFFRINNEADNYRLSEVGTYSGNADTRYALTYHRNQQFSTKDRDHDSYSGHCAQRRFGAWWYNNCAYSNLNGRYSDAFYYLPGSFYLKFSEMKLRPILDDPMQ